MSRRIALTDDGGYRAVTIWRGLDGETRSRHEGIYDKIGTARARISFWRNRLGDDLIDGWVEKATITWEKVDGK